ncbi:MAG: beta-propeller fold lactonase family protein, partial [Silvanigrellaceae bacterium]|nr:beta-propeller fold lactonase family protein [Silvanigrellaceae bacterium]
LIFFCIFAFFSCSKSANVPQKNNFSTENSPQVSVQHEPISSQSQENYSSDQSNGSSDLLNQIFFTNMNGLGRLHYEPLTGLLASQGENYTSIGAFPVNFTLTSDDKFLYVLNTDLGSLAAYSLNGLGDMTPLNPFMVPLVTANALQVVTTLNNTFAYVLNDGSSANHISVYGINTNTGQLSLISNTSLTSLFTETIKLSSIVVSSDSQTLFVSGFDEGSSSHFIIPFQILSDGSLANIDFNDNISGQKKVTINASSQANTNVLIPVTTALNLSFLYMIENAGSNVSIFSVSPGGSLQTENSFFGTQPIVFGKAAPDGSCIYAYSISDQGEFKMVSFGINPSSGELTQTSSISLETDVIDFVVSPDNKFLYVLVKNTIIKTFSIDSVTGTLTLIPEHIYNIGLILTQIKINQSGSVVFVSLSTMDSNDIIKFSRNLSTGELTFPHFNNVSKIIGIVSSVLVTKDRKYAYVANSSENKIYQYTMNSANGDITPSSPGSISTQEVPLFVAHFKDKFIYTSNTISSNILCYSIDQTTGQLTYLFTFPTVGVHLERMTIVSFSSGENYLYVTETISNFFLQYAIDPSSGYLTPLSPNVAFVEGNKAKNLVAVPGTRFAYAINRGGENQILQLIINENTGALSKNTDPKVINEDKPWLLVVTPDGKYAYVYTKGTGKIYQYSISTNGTLVELGQESVPTEAVFSYIYTLSMTITPDSKYLYIGFQNGLIYQYSIGIDGQLSPLTPQYVQTLYCVFSMAGI